MKPIKFEGCNIVMGKGQEHVLPLHAHKDLESVEGTVTAIFELSEEEIEDIIRTRQIHYRQDTYHNPMHPMMIWTEPEKVKEV